MTVEEIRNLISEAEYDYIGIRADSRLIWLDIVRPIHHMRRINNMMSETSI